MKSCTSAVILLIWQSERDLIGSGSPTALRIHQLIQKSLELHFILSSLDMPGLGMPEVNKSNLVVIKTEGASMELAPFPDMLRTRQDEALVKISKHCS